MHKTVLEMPRILPRCVQRHMTKVRKFQAHFGRSMWLVATQKKSSSGQKNSTVRDDQSIMVHSILNLATQNFAAHWTCPPTKCG